MLDYGTTALSWESSYNRHETTMEDTAVSPNVYQWGME